MKHLLTYLLILSFSGYILAQRNSQAPDNFRYKMEDGKLKLEKTYFNIGNAYNTEIKKASTAIYNDSDQPMEITFSGVPAYVSMKVSPKVIPAKTKGLIELEYRVSENKDHQKKQKWGHQNARIKLLVNGNTQNNRNNLNVRVNIQEDFRNLTEAQLKKAPKIKFKEMVYDFGTVNQGDKITHEFVFENLGKEDLIIRNIKASCGCTAVSSSDESVKQGKSSSIKAVFNTKGKRGSQSKSITVNTNDPKQPVLVIKMKGQVLVPNAANKTTNKK